MNKEVTHKQNEIKTPITLIHFFLCFIVFLII